MEKQSWDVFKFSDGQEVMIPNEFIIDRCDDESLLDGSPSFAVSFNGYYKYRSKEVFERELIGFEVVFHEEKVYYGYFDFCVTVPFGTDQENVEFIQELAKRNLLNQAFPSSSLLKEWAKEGYPIHGEYGSKYASNDDSFLQKIVREYRVF
ncbi:hypothetical protein COL23_25745 [Priestia aryabhattai]|uniref:hypothetical protein n=1 Tax=Priestia aryabhattai TaxID=412384 RepID=UPI000BF33F97|nr:hypothetical protein [Priestia aryabhattai]PFW72157.1 hypothetical protein COL23_25745 [Priestia aryabhattai]